MRNLEPAEQYCLKVIATDANGKQETTYRTFTTWRRYVTVQYQQFKVLQTGGDDDYGGMWIQCFVGGTVVKDIVYDSGDWLQYTHSTWYQLTGATKTLQHNATWLTIMVDVDEDDFPFGEVKAQNVTQLNVADPSNAPTQYADDESFGRPFTQHVQNDDLELEFKGTYTVVYQP